MRPAIYKSFLLFIFMFSFAGFTLAQTEREKGIEFYQKGEYEKAVESLQRAVEADKENQESQLYLGMSFAKLDKEKEAVAAFEKADKLPKKELPENEKDVQYISKNYPRYTDKARQNNVRGTVSMAVEFGANGEIKFIFAFQKLADGLTENAIDVTRKIKFEPAAKDGKPVSKIKIIQYSFTIY